MLYGGCLRRIQEVYDRCSRLDHQQDELWLFGFGRGAFIVRAVAGLLHTFGAVPTAGQAQSGSEFKKMLQSVQVLQLQ